MGVGHLVLTTILGGRHCHCPHFIDGRTESERREDLSRTEQQARDNIKVQISASAEPPPCPVTLKEVMLGCCGDQGATELCDEGRG